MDKVEETPSLQIMKSDEREDIRQAKKASCRGKMSHVTKLINRLKTMMLEDVGRREIEGMMKYIQLITMNTFLQLQTTKKWILPSTS